MKEYNIDDLEAALLDAINPDWNAEDIMYFCDLSIERSIEISNLLKQVRQNYDKRHGIKE